MGVLQPDILSSYHKTAGHQPTLPHILKSMTMKRLFLPALFVLNFLHGYCQPQNKISVGFKAGYDHTVINARELNGSPSGFTGDQFYVGIFANKWLSNKINT